MSDTLRAGKLIASAILIIGGLAVAAFYPYHRDFIDEIAALISILGCCLFLESWFNAFTKLWKALTAPPPGFVKNAQEKTDVHHSSYEDGR